MPQGPEAARRPSLALVRRRVHVVSLEGGVVSAREDTRAHEG